MKRFLFELYLFGVVGYTCSKPEHGLSWHLDLCQTKDKDLR